MLDESRHFFGKEKVKQLLDLMAYYKLNKFHWHLTDEPGWRIEIEKYPRLTSVGGKGNWSNPQDTVFLPDGYAITGDDTNEYKMQIFAPVIVAGDVTGGVILLSKSEKNVAEKTKLAEFSAKILANSLQ